jgi:hypothetical protein
MKEKITMSSFREMGEEAGQWHFGDFFSPYFIFVAL